MNQPTNGKSTATKSAPKNKKASGLQQLFVDELKDIYWAEKALTKAIPKMIKKATSPKLREALQDHLKVTQHQVSRCESVFESIGVKVAAKKCEAMEGLIKEAQEIMQSTEEGSVRDAGIISAAQKVEHYEMASYGTLATFAGQLGFKKAATLLQATLKEEKEADTALSKVAENNVNQDAITGKNGK
ncbi:MAG: ferritin-like domain-containing protein [Saprospiraceae bacterium]